MLKRIAVLLVAASAAMAAQAPRPLDRAAEKWVRDTERGLAWRHDPRYREVRYEDLAADPQLIARGHWPVVPHAELGPVTVEGPRSTMSRTPPAMRWAGPTFGQHNDQILRDILGLSDEEIVEAVSSGAIG